MTTPLGSFANPLAIFQDGSYYQFLAFLLAKGDAPDLLKALSHWVLTRADYPETGGPLPPDFELIEVKPYAIPGTYARYVPMTPSWGK